MCTLRTAGALPMIAGCAKKTVTGFQDLRNAPVAREACFPIAFQELVGSPLVPNRTREVAMLERCHGPPGFLVNMTGQMGTPYQR
jgi:hypothetical protein